MRTISYQQRRGQLETYFDRTAAEAWSRLTSDAPVGRIRATVRAGRDRMRDTLLSCLPADLTGRRILDAGCGTGAFAVEAARRGADVIAIDLSGTLVSLARERTPADLGKGSITFHVGDMCDPALGRFDHVVAMDSLIHYQASDIVGTLAQLAPRTTRSICFTFAPRTPALSILHAVGRLIPNSDRAPAIEPVGEATLRRGLRRDAVMGSWRFGKTERISGGFYTSQAMELARV